MEAEPNLGPLGNLLASASGADASIDRAIAKAFRVDLADYSSSAVTARNFVAEVLPQATLRVGYDVCGIFPCATIFCGGLRYSSVAPTVPLAILRALALASGV